MLVQGGLKMSNEEKIVALVGYCGKRVKCQGCVLNRHHINCKDGILKVSEMSEAEIEKAYNLVFGKTDAPISGISHGGPPYVIIKYSGDRREFGTGAVRDMSEGKGRMDLLPWAAIMEISKHCENGAKKYGEHNVDKGIPLHSLCDSAARHLAKYLDGWDDEPHLLAAAWNLLWAIQMEIKHPELCDIPWKEDDHA